MEGERVYQYEFDCSRVNLVPEPENKYDSNAIRVEVEGVHIGYIKKGSTSRIRKLMEKDMISWINIEIGGGKYKVLDEDGNIERDSSDYYAKLSIRIKADT